jgi:hypothetical protein
MEFLLIYQLINMTSDEIEVTRGTHVGKETISRTTIYIYIYIITVFQTGRDSSVGIATRYRLNGPEIEFLWGRDFPHPSRPAPGGPPSLLYNRYRVSPGGKTAGAWC